VCPVVPGGVAGPLAPAGSLACPWPSSAAKPWPWSRCSASTAGGWPTNCARHKAGGTASRWWTGSCWGSWRSRSAMPDQAQLIRDFTSSPAPPRPPSSPGPPRRPGMAGARSIPFKTRSPPLPNLAEADPRYRQGGAMRGRSGPFWDGVEGRAPIPPRRGPGIPGGVAARRRRGGRRHRHRDRVAGWIAGRIADGDQPSTAGWTDAPHAHATRVPSGDVERGFTEGWNEFLDRLVTRIQTWPAT
jgi:hypothetical protein